MKRTFALSLLALLTVLCSFAFSPVNEDLPKPITKTTTFIDGKEVEKTVILLDGSTSREDLIHTCNFLAKEDVQLTFEKLSIGKRFLGLFGKQRIRMAQGMITLPNGASQRFKAGGAASFRSIKIQYASHPLSQSSRIEIVEIVD